MLLKEDKKFWRSQILLNEPLKLVYNNHNDCHVDLLYNMSVYQINYTKHFVIMQSSEFKAIKQNKIIYLLNVASDSPMPSP